MRILIVEDDALLGDGLREGLSQRGFQADWVRDGFAGARELRAEPYAAAVVDINLPRRDGFQILDEVRAAGVRTPILMLTARDALDDRIAGLDGGADDYVVKPVDIDELAARLRALIRRAHGSTGAQLRVGTLELDPARRAVTLAGEAVSLAHREFDLLELLMLNEGKVLSREALEQQLYGWGADLASNAIEVHIHHLRRKLGERWILTVRGVGYAIAVPPSEGRG